MTIESMLNDIFGVVIVVMFVVLIVFLICLLILLYLSEDRKKMIKDLEKKEQENKLVLDRYFNCMINKANLETKVELLEKYIYLYSGDNDE